MKISKKFVFSVIILAILYFLLIIYVQNISLINTTIFQGSNVMYKIQLLIALLEGITSTMTSIEFVLFIITGLLIGINLTLILQKLKLVKKTSKGYFFAGSSSLVGIFGGGCASCGLPFLSVLGLSSAVVYLPFKGAELPYISIALLLFSLLFLLKNKDAQMCEVKNRVKRA